MDDRYIQPQENNFGYLAISDKCKILLLAFLVVESQMNAGI